MNRPNAKETVLLFPCTIPPCYRRYAVEALVFCAVLACLGVQGVSSLRDVAMPGVQQTFPGTSFAPAVALAAGEGFRRVEPSSAPAVEAFLLGATKTLPDDALAHARYIAPSPQDRRHYYLEYLVGLTWRYGGIRWRALAWPVMWMYLALGGIAYGLLRLWANRWLAAAGTVLALSSGPMLALLPQLRDFGRAVFILGALLGVACLMRAPVKRGRWWGTALALGLFCGVGYGFREDTVIAIPVALAGFGFLAPLEGTWRWARRAGALAVFAGAFLLAASPTLTGRETPGGTLWHYALLGLPTSETNKIGFGNSSYEYVTCLEDSYLADMADRTRRRWSENTEAPGWMLSDAEAQGSIRYLSEIVRRFPADLCARGVSSVLHVLGQGAGLPGGVAAFGACWTVLALGLLAWRNGALAWKAGGIGAYFLSISAINPGFRHIFYLYFIPVAGLVYVLQCLAETLRRKQEDAPPRRSNGKHLIALAALGLCCAGVFGGLCWGQMRQWDGLLRQYEQAELAPLTAERIEETSATLYRVRGLGTEYLLDAPVAWDYLAVDLELPGPEMYVQLRYASETGNDAPFTHIVRVERGRDDSPKVRLFFPIFQCAEASEWIAFDGIAFQPGDAGAFRNVFRVTNHRDFPLLLVFAMPEHPASARLRKTIVWKSVSPERQGPEYIGTPHAQRGWPLEGLSGETLRDWCVAWLQRDRGAYTQWMLLGRAEEELRAWDEARAAYREAIRVLPGFPAGYARLDTLLENETRPEFWRGMCAELRGYALPWLYLGRALAGKGEWADAVDAYTESLRMEPACLRAMRGLAEALALSGLSEDAMAARTAAVLAAANAANPYGAAAFARCFAPPETAPAFPAADIPASTDFEALARAGRCEEAVTRCEDAIARAPEDFALARGADAVFRQCLGLEKTAACWKELSRRLPVRAHALFFEGIAFLDAEQFREAHACFHEALEEMPDAAFTRGFLGVAQLRLGQCAAAKESLERALRAVPGAEEFTKPLEEAKACAGGG